MSSTLRVLLVEDEEDDALLLLHELQRLGHEVVLERVETREALLAALARTSWDVLISDFSLPRFSAPEALKACKQQGYELPFIIVSGTIDEEAAVEALRSGADDFINKSRLARLGPAIARGRRDFAERQARRGAEARLRQAQKLEAVGQLAGGVAHDFNNLLGVIQGHAELLTKRLAGDAASMSRLTQVLEAAQRGAGLTRQLLAFSRRQPLEARPLDLNAVVSGMRAMLRRLISENIEIVATLDPRLRRVKADKTQAEQVLMNLAINARDAMGAGGRLEIQTGNVELDQRYTESHPDAQPGPHVMLAVEDNGHGMDAATLSHVFEPFYTTKEQGKGTGLGLATVYGIVRQSGGHVAVSSVPGRGTTFRVYLPATDEREPATLSALTAATQAQSGGTETVVLVEDEPALRSVIHALLLEGGYNVVEGEAPEASVATAVAYAGRIDVVLSDVVMPRLSGAEAAARILRAHPEAKLLFMSGYANTGEDHAASLPAGHAFLQKPFSLDTLLRKLREVLDSSA